VAFTPSADNKPKHKVQDTSTKNKIMEALAFSRPGGTRQSATHKTISRAQSSVPGPRSMRQSAISHRGQRASSAVGSRRMPRNESDSVAMSSWELNFIKNVSIDEKLKVRPRSKKAPSNARRKRMESLERVEISRHQKPLSILERQLLDRTPEAQAMRNIMANAETMAGRDAQLFERKKKQDYEHKYDTQMHDMMERDRQAAIEQMFRRDELNDLKSKDRARTINAQLEDRQEQRLRRQDEIEYEKEDFKRACLAREAEEMKKLQAKRLVAQQQKAELVVSNKRAMQTKIRMKKRDQEADAQILIYQRNKLSREEKVEEEKAAIKYANDKLHDKMLHAQERAIDLRGAQDEARMLASFREKEDRHWRIDKVKKEQKKKDLKELKIGWEQQKQQKAALIARQATMDRWETTNQENAAYLAQKKMDDVADRKRVATYKNNDELLQQIDDRTTNRIRRTTEYRQTKDANMNAQKEKNKDIEKIRREAVEKMKKNGYPKKYWHKLEGKSLGLARQITPSDAHTF